MKHYCLLLLALTAVRSWSIGHSGDVKELTNSDQKVDEQSQSWDSNYPYYYRTGRSGYRGREIFGKRALKPALPEGKRQRLMELLEQARGNNDFVLSDDDSDINRLLLEPEFWARLNDYYHFLYGPKPFQRERRRRRTQRELFG